MVYCNEIQSYLHEEDFGNTLMLCMRALRSNEQIPLADRARIEIQIAAIYLLTGTHADHLDAIARLERMKQERQLPEAQDTDAESIQTEISLWLGRSYMKAGRYDAAGLKLSQALPGSSKLEDLLEVGRGILHVLSVHKGQALLHACFVEPNLAQKDITHLRDHTRAFIDRKQMSRAVEHEGSPERSNAPAETRRTGSPQRNIPVFSSRLQRYTIWPGTMRQRLP